MTAPAHFMSALCSSRSPSSDAPVVIVCAPDPWAWSLDSLIAAIGALGTIAVAVIAVVITIRSANKNRREDERQRRVRLAAAIDRYVDVRSRGIATNERQAMDDTALAEGFDPDPAPVQWAARYGEDVMVLWRDMPRDAGGSPLSQVWWLAYLRRRTDIRRRVSDWIASGRSDSTPAADLSFDNGGEPFFMTIPNAG